MFKVTRKQFEKVVNKFAYRDGKMGVLKIAKITEEDLSWKCCLHLMGGFTNSIELVDECLYKDGKIYCDLRELFGEHYNEFINDK